MIYSEATFDEETKVITGPEEVYVPDPRGIGHAYFTQMRRNRYKIAQHNVDTGESETFGSVLLRSINTSIAMRNRGIKPGSIISICAANSMHNYIPFIAAQMTGAIVASLDPTISLIDSVHLLKQVAPQLVFTDQKSERLIENAALDAGVDCEIVVIGESNKYDTFADFCGETNSINDYEPHVVDDLSTTAVILFSSGTTGLSKGICLSHNGLFYQAHSFCNSGMCMERILSFATTYWVSTLMMINITCIFGKRRCILEKFSPKELWHSLDQGGITFTFLAPSAAIMLLKAGRPDGVDTTRLRDVMIGGGSLSAENVLAFRDLLPGTNVQLAYGQSEDAGVVTMFRMGVRGDVLLAHNKPTSSGKPVMGHAYKIVDPETDQILGPNELGELRYKSNSMMNGYHGRDSSEAYDDEGWIRSGDIAYFDDDFCFYIVDRIKDMLKYQGFHVPPAKLEGILNMHPQVAASVVIGIPDEDDGDHAMGLVVLQPGATATANDLAAFVDEQVDDRNKLRGGVRILTSFPYTPSGKVKRNLLRKMILAGEL